MNSREFAPDSPGTLIAIEGGLAFMPDFLPPEIPIDREMARAVGAARGALGEFVGESKLVRNERLITHPFMVKEAVESNKIEGTFTEVENVLMEKVAGPPSDPVMASNQRDVYNYIQTIELGESKIREGWPLSKALMCALHSQLLRGSAGSERLLGEYRKVQVYIGNQAHGIAGARFVPPPPEQVIPLMENLRQFSTDESLYDPLIDCAILHYQFETIHPFEDGNGRMGRLLIPLYLTTKGLLERPVLYLSSFFETHRTEYMDFMKSVSTENSWPQWIMFFLKAVRERAEESRNRVRTILELHEHYRDIVKRNTTTQVPLLAVDLILESPYVTVSQLVDYANTTFPTAQKALRVLASLGIISEFADRYPQTWVAGDLLDRVYK